MCDFINQLAKQDYYVAGYLNAKQARSADSLVRYLDLRVHLFTAKTESANIHEKVQHVGAYLLLEEPYHACG